MAQRIPPFWWIFRDTSLTSVSGIPITLCGNDGWGDGTHDTTQLCLQAIGHFHPQAPFSAADFGSGSGILSLALAKLGAKVDAIEIETKALESSQESARANGVEGNIRFATQFRPDFGGYDLIVANILKPVLMDFADALGRRLKPGGVLILSGLVATDCPELIIRYREHTAGLEPSVFRRGEWCCLVWR